MPTPVTASAELLTVIAAVAASLVAWFSVPKGLYELLALWRDRGYRRAKRAIEFAKEFPDEPTFREHARRLTSAAMVDVNGLTHAQRMALLKDEQTQVQRVREFRRWLSINVSAGQIEWTWRRAELADPKRRRFEQLKLFGAYLGCIAIAFLPLIGWRMVSGAVQPPWPVLAVLLLIMVVFLLVAIAQPHYASTLRRAGRFMLERSSTDR